MLEQNITDLDPVFEKELTPSIEQKWIAFDQARNPRKLDKYFQEGDRFEVKYT